MKRFFAKVLTVLLTAGILFSGSSLPVMADDSATDTQVSEDSYVLPKDSYYLYIIELLDENGQPLPGNMVYYNSVPYWGDPSIAQSAYILSENDNLNTVHSTSRDLLGVDKFRLRVSIREDVELTLKKVDTPSFSEFDSFDGFEPCKAGEISEVYSFDDDRIDFYGLLSHEGKKF